MYRSNTPLMHIIKDGWFRQLDIIQTWNECLRVGYDIQLEHIENYWNQYDEAGSGLMLRAAMLEW